MQKKWIIREPSAQLVERLQKHLGINKIICQVLANRGVNDCAQAERFLNPRILDLRDPFELKDMEKAVSRIKRAIKDKENILIFSDYDVDGVTSCAILETELQLRAALVSHYIPHRLNEGYGLSMTAVTIAKKRNATLLLVLDSGIKSVQEVKALRAHGIDTIIIDHHEPDEDALPEAVAIINPKRKDCSFGFCDFAAVGLVYKLACAFDNDNRERYLDLASLGTIADVMPLVDENRIIVKQGLSRMNANATIGIQALIEASGLKDKEINPSRVSFILAPRINASGRVDTAETSLQLLLSSDYESALQLAGRLNTHNRCRQKIEEEVFQEALGLVERTVNFSEHNVIVLSRQDWHQGVLGIVASKIADKFLRPTIIISLKNGTGKGSGRSVVGFHLFEALIGCKEHLLNFGGHAHAVGLRIAKENIGNFCAALNEIAKMHFASVELQPVLHIDAQLPLMFLQEELLAQTKALEPFGLGNPKPLFCSHNLTVKSQAQVLGRETIKFWVTDGECTYEAIGFGLREFAPYIVAGRRIDIAYHLSMDSWKDVNSLLLEIKDIKFLG